MHEPSYYQHRSSLSASSQHPSLRQSYFPEYEIFAPAHISQPSSQQQHQQQYTRNYASEGVARRDNGSSNSQFQVSNHTAFRFYSEQKQKPQQQQQSYQQQQDEFYSNNSNYPTTTAQLPTNSFVNQQYLKPSNQKHFEKIRQQIGDDSRHSLDYSRVSSQKQQRQHNDSYSSNSSVSSNNNSFYAQSQHSSSQQSGATRGEDDTTTATNDLIYKGEHSFVNAISRKKLGIIKDILFFVSVFVAILFLYFSYQKVYNYYGTQAKQNVEQFQEYYTKNSILSNMTGDIQYNNAATSTNTQPKTVEYNINPNTKRIRQLGLDYYRQFFEMTQEAEGKIHKNTLLAKLITEEPNEWEEIFEEVQSIRKRKDEIDELKNDATQMYVWIIR